MPSELKLDRSDPAVDEMVSQWQEGGKYTITLDVTQGKESGSMVTFAVDAVTDYGEPEAADDSDADAETESGSAGTPPKKQGNPAMVIMMGNARRG